MNGKMLIRVLATIVGILAIGGFGLAQAGRGIGHLSGFVGGEAGEPVAGARVQIEFPQGGKAFQTETNLKGEWRLTGLGTGSVTITVSAEGYVAVKLQYKVEQLAPNAPVRIVLKEKGGERPAEGKARVTDGYGLLDGLITALQSMTTGTVPDKLEEHLVQLLKEAKRLREAGQLDATFFFRYQRLLTVFKLIITPDAGLLVPVINQEISHFVQQVTGEPWVRSKGPESLNKVAGAIEEEFVDLQLYLENRQAKEELKKKLAKRMLPPPPASQGKQPEKKEPEGQF